MRWVAPALRCGPRWTIQCIRKKERARRWKPSIYLQILNAKAGRDRFHPVRGLSPGFFHGAQRTPHHDLQAASLHAASSHMLETQPHLPPAIGMKNNRTFFPAPVFWYW